MARSSRDLGMQHMLTQDTFARMKPTKICATAPEIEAYSAYLVHLGGCRGAVEG